MEKLKLSPLRKFMLWVFGSPSNDPYVKVNIDFEFQNALNFIKKYNENSKIKISIHIFLIKALADTLANHKKLNVKIFGNEIYKLESINIATPINLVNENWEEGESNELGVTIIKDAHEKTLEEIANELKKDVKNYQKGGSSIFLEEIAKFLYKHLPDFSLKLFFKGVSLLGKNKVVYDIIQELMGVSTIFTNVGSIIHPKYGIHYKSLSFTLPDTLLYLSCCFGAGPIERKPVVKDDKIEILPLLPFLIIFDHRIIDGFLMNKFIEEMGERIFNPEKFYFKDK